MRRERRDHLEVVRIAPVPAADRAAGERQARMAHDAVDVEEAPRTEPVAVGARSDRVVEREEPRLELRDAVAADRARELVREDERLALFVEERDLRDAVAERERGLERLGEPEREVVPHADPIDDDLDVVLLLRVQLRRIVELDERAVDARADEAL